MSFTKEIDLYYTSTPNGWKVEIALEEYGIPYKIHKIDIANGDQFKPEFLKISPNNKIPAIVDPNETNADGEPLSIFESGAILIYLAQKTGKLLPDAKQDPAGNAEVHQWLMWQMAGFGPMLGQFNHFNNYAPEKIPYAIERYTKEAQRLFNVLDAQLAKHTYVAKSGFSIADIAIFGWAALFIWRQNALEIPSNVKRWYNELSQRPAIAKLVPIYQQRIAEVANRILTDEQKKLLFGITPKSEK
jgi:GST-like protein